MTESVKPIPNSLTPEFTFDEFDYQIADCLRRWSEYTRTLTALDAFVHILARWHREACAGRVAEIVVMRVAAQWLQWQLTQDGGQS